MNWFDILKKDPWEDRPVSLASNSKCFEEARVKVMAIYQGLIDDWIKDNPNHPAAQIEGRINDWSAAAEWSSRHTYERLQNKIEVASFSYFVNHVRTRARGHGAMNKGFNEIYREWDACVRGAWSREDLFEPGKGTGKEFKERWG
jgi:hypothetical protein